jgi:hypothetical protein
MSFYPHNQWQMSNPPPPKHVKAGGGAFGFVLHKSWLLAKAGFWQKQMGPFRLLVGFCKSKSKSRFKSSTKHTLRRKAEATTK